MHLEYASRVDHKVAHASVAGRIGLTLGGVALGVVIIASGGVGGFALVANLATIGRFLGDITDRFIPPSASNKIITGHPTVLLGTAHKHAARANPDTTTDCGHTIVEGSELVMIGSEFAPMSRRQDRDSGNGTIVEGEESIIVGGEPSMKGKDIETDDGAVLFWMDAMLALANLGVGLDDALAAGSKAEWARLAGNAAATGLGYTPAADAGGVLGSISSMKSPFSGGALNAINQGIGGFQGAEAATGLIGG